MVRKSIIFLGALLFSSLVIQPTFAQANSLAGAPIVPNQFIVKYKTSEDTYSALNQTVKEREEQKKSGMTGIVQYYFKNMQYTVQQKQTPEQRLVSISDLRREFQIKEEKKLFNTKEKSAEAYQIVKTDGSASIQDVVEEYQRLETVEWAMADTLLTINETPNDPQFAQMWGLKKIEADKAWDITKGSTSVTVAVIDTGGDFNHPDLKDNLIPGYNSLIGKAGGQDDHYHGTHVSGTIAAVTNNAAGVSGINWITKVMPIKALDSQGSGALSAIANGMKYAIDNAEANNIKVINMSLGGKRYQSGQDECQTLFNGIIQQAKAKNITVVVAAGNSNQNLSGFVPAACEGVISVGASDQADKKASFSNFGTTISLSAPGVSIMSTSTGNKYQALQGTSMASPHVAGVAALMYAVNPTITADQVKTILTTAANLDPLQSTGIGVGRLNALKAVQAAGGSAPAPSATGTQPTATIGPTAGISPTVTSPPSVTTTISPTSVPIPVPSTPPYACTPATLPTQEASEDCGCNNGTCSSTCSFYGNTPSTSPAPSVSIPAPTSVDQPGVNQCPIGFTCTDVSACTGRAYVGSCPDEQICCFNGLAVFTDTATVQATMKCATKTGADNDAFCKRSLRTAGDADGDGKVNHTDYLYLVRALSSADLPENITADFNGDGSVNESDKQILTGNLKRLCY